MAIPPSKRLPHTYLEFDVFPKPENEIHKKIAVTKYYDHSKGINLKKIPAYYVSRITNDLIFKSNIYKFFSKVTNKWTVSYKSESNKIERMIPWDEFLGSHTYYNHTNPQYYNVLQKLQTDIQNNMTVEEFFNRNNRKYSLDWNKSYD